MTISLETAQKLKQAGFKKETENYWGKPVVNGESKNHYVLVNVDELCTSDCYANHDYLPAPSTDELLEELPASVVFVSRCFLQIHKTDEDFLAIYLAEIEGESVWRRATDLPEALAELWLELRKEGLV